MGNCLSFGNSSATANSVNKEKNGSNLLFNSKELENLRANSGGIPLLAFTVKELKAITANFRQEYLLGSGGFGKVYKGFIKEKLREGLHPLEVAVKVYKKDVFKGQRGCLAELTSLAQVSHPNIVKLIGHCLEDAGIYGIYEFMPRGSAFDNLFSREMPPLPWAIRMKIAFGAARGLAFLHEAKRPIIHRDIKTSTILLDAEYNAKLSGFGFSREGPVGDKTHVSTEIAGTFGYLAPEYVMTGHLTAMCDVFGFGVVLLELLTGRRAYDKTLPKRKSLIVDWAPPLIAKKRKIFDIVDPRLDGDYPVKAVRKIAMLAFDCVKLNPKNRPLMRDIVEALEPLQRPVEIPNSGTV